MATLAEKNQNPNIGALGSAEYQQFSDRIKGFCGKIVEEGSDYHSHYVQHVEPLRAGNYSRIIDRAIISQSVDLTEQLDNYGMHQEARIPLGGRWEGYDWLMVGCNMPGRQLSEQTFSQLGEIISRTSAQLFSNPKELPTDFSIEVLRESNLRPGDIDNLAKIFSSAFDDYITPVTDPNFLQEMVKDLSVIPVIIRNQDGHIVSVGSGEMGTINLNTKNGEVKEFKFLEIGDLASQPDYRNNGFNRIITQKLIKEAKNLGYDSVHAEARACWDVVNYLFAKNGFTFRGTLPLNTVIRGPESVSESNDPALADYAKKYGSLNVWSLTPADAAWENF